MKNIYVALAFAILLTLTSCKDDFASIQNPAAPNHIAESDKSFETQFLALWEGINQSYVFWDIDAINWDFRRYDLINLGATLDKDAKRGTLNWDNDNTKWNIAKPFLGLLDHHLVVKIINPYETDAEKREKNALYVSPGEIEAYYRDYYHVPVKYADFDKAFKQTVGENRYSDYHFETHTFKDINRDFYVISALIDGSIPYLHISDYCISMALSELEPTSPVIEALEHFFFNIKKLHNEGRLTAIILDNRCNSGGSAIDLEHIIGNYITTPQTAAKTRTKNGLGKYDFGHWKDYNIPPYTANKYYVGDIGQVPYVVLMDVNSKSLAEVSASVVSRCFNSMLIGERTFGAHGNLYTSYTYEQNGYNGSFNIPGSGHGVYAANSECQLFFKRAGDWGVLEGYGIYPDILCEFDAKLFEMGTDNQLDRALKYIRTGL
ncbi:MAG: hypothetical protein II708_05010 [Paludibacteraceae bacterium]|nr:hypothetical protein [Paludibacteraceae bacterium]